MLKLDESSNGQEIALPLGQEFEICLAENPTTGFQWHFESRGELACLLLDNFFEAAVDQPGKGGSHYWRFQAAHAGTANIVLVYKRSWEPEKQPVRRFALHIHIPAQ